MKYVVLVLGVLFALSACNKSQEKEELENENMYAAIMVDMAIAKRILEKTEETKADSIQEVLYETICDIHGITVQQYLFDLREIQRNKTQYASLLNRSFEMAKEMEKENNAKLIAQ